MKARPPGDERAPAPKLTKLQRLRLYAEAAPIIRARLLDFDRSKRVRPIFVRKSDGTTERLTPHEFRIRLLVSELTRLGIEIDEAADGKRRGVNAGVRPLALFCACGMPYLVPPTGLLPPRCPDCYRCRELVSGKPCGRRLHANAWAPHRMRQRRGAPARCARCSPRLTKRTPGASKYSRERRSRDALAACARLSPAERSERIRKGWDTRRRGAQ